MIFATQNRLSKRRLRDFDPSVVLWAGRDRSRRRCSGRQRRLIDGMFAKAAKRVEDTAAYTYGSDRSAAELCARLVGSAPGEAKRAIETAAQARVVAVDGRGGARRASSRLDRRDLIAHDRGR